MGIKNPSQADRRGRGKPLTALEPHKVAFEHHLRERGHAETYIAVCKRSVAHLASWMGQEHRRLAEIDEALVREFVDEHLPRCRCGAFPRDRRTTHAALRHLLSVLRGASAIAARAIDTTPVGEELRRYDQYMKQARGLSTNTREGAIRIVGRLLRQRFGGGVVNFATIKPEHVRRFYAEQAQLYKTPASAGVVISSLRGYFRWRATRGDQVHALVGALSYPANWQRASLPKSLKPEEVAQLVASFGEIGPSHLRADAMMRCALDLGLRVGEVARLSLDDIDWQAATLTLRHTKGRREDVLPLPATTGQAIAAYLRHERPAVQHRMVFARHLTPREQLLTVHAVRTIIRRAFARAGLPHTRSHLLRHTMAARLLDGGASLKEVADVLRHRSLNTTLIYAKLDSRSLIEVALPWPGTPVLLPPVTCATGSRP
jgi:site-specific recombinase XerD